MAHQLLSTIQRYLSEESLDCSYFEEAEGSPARLLIYMGADSSKREKIIEITADEQAMPSHFSDIDAIQVQKGFYRLQIQSVVPFNFDPNYASQMASSINFLNGMLELPGLISDELEDKVYYKTVQIVAEQDCEKNLLLGLVGVHRLVIDMFAGLLEKIGTGQITYLNLLDEIVKYTRPKS